MFGEGWESDSTWQPGNRKKHDWEALKKQGIVTENIQEKDGIRTITRTWVSFDKSETIYDVETTFITNNMSERIKEIDKLIEEAVQNENYEEAAKLKKERDKLVNPPKQKTKSKKSK